MLRLFGHSLVVREDDQGWNEGAHGDDICHQ